MVVGQRREQVSSASERRADVPHSIETARTLKANEMSPNNNRVIVFSSFPYLRVSPEESGDGSTESKEFESGNDKDG